LVVEALAKKLRSQPEILASEATEELLKNYRRLSAIVDDLKATAEGLQRLDSVLRNAGLSYALREN